MEHDEINGASSDPGQPLALTIRKIMEKELEPLVLKMVSRVIKPMVITTVRQEIVPLAEDLIRRVVKEVFQPVEEKLLNEGSRDELPKGGSLHLKFLDDVSDAVTGEELKGIKYECLKLALLDPDGNTVACGRESSAKVEILLLHDNGNANDDMTIENFERSIIQTGEKKKPHFAKSVYISLKKGVGDLNGLKLGHDKDWIKLCNCRLGARIGQNLEGTAVQEAWTPPFKVTDKRDKQYDKHPRPSLSSEVWRLEGICRSGKRCDRLKDKNIKTLQDFLFWFHVNPEELQKQILRVGDGTWKTTVTHAETCIVDDKKMYSHKSSTEPQMRVIYDVVGELKGVIDESNFVPIHNLSPDRKDRARNLLSSLLEVSAFGERYNNVEASLLHELPLQHCWNGSGLTVLSENMSGYDSGPSSDCLGSKEMGELCNPTCGPSPADPDGEIHKCVGNNKVNYAEDFRHLENHSCPTSMLLLSENNKHKRLVAASSSGHSNDSFDSARSAMEKGWFDDEDCYRPGPPSPDLMLPYVDDTYSYNTRSSGHCYEESSLGHGYDEGSAVAVDQPKGWKKLSRLWSTLRERISVDVSSSHKKRRVG